MKKRALALALTGALFTACSGPTAAPATGGAAEAPKASQPKPQETEESAARRVHWEGNFWHGKEEGGFIRMRWGRLQGGRKTHTDSGRSTDDKA